LNIEVPEYVETGHLITSLWHYR